MNVLFAGFPLFIMVSAALIDESIGLTELDIMVRSLETLAESTEKSIQIFNHQLSETTNASLELMHQNVNILTSSLEAAVNASGVDTDSHWIGELIETGRTIIKNAENLTDQCIQTQIQCSCTCLANLGEVASDAVSLIAKGKGELGKCGSMQFSFKELCLSQVAVKLATGEQEMSTKAAGLVTRITLLLGRLQNELEVCVSDNFATGKKSIQDSVISKLV